MNLRNAFVVAGVFTSVAGSWLATTAIVDLFNQRDHLQSQVGALTNRPTQTTTVTAPPTARATPPIPVNQGGSSSATPRPSTPTIPIIIRRGATPGGVVPVGVAPVGVAPSGPSGGSGGAPGGGNGNPGGGGSTPPSSQPSAPPPQPKPTPPVVVPPIVAAPSRTCPVGTILTARAPTQIVSCDAVKVGNAAVVGGTRK